MSTKKKQKSSTVKFLENLNGGPLTFGDLIHSIRKGNEQTLADFAKMLQISRQHLCDIEKGRKMVSPERAARFAQVLGYSQAQFVRLSLQALLDEANLKMHVEVRAA